MSALVKHIRSALDLHIGNALSHRRGENGLPETDRLFLYNGKTDEGAKHLIDSDGTYPARNGQCWQWDGSAYIDNIQDIAFALDGRGGTIEVGYIPIEVITIFPDFCLFGGEDDYSVNLHADVMWTCSSFDTNLSLGVVQEDLNLNELNIIKYEFIHELGMTFCKAWLNGVKVNYSEVSQENLTINSFRLGNHQSTSHKSGYTTYYRIWDADGNEVAFIPCINAVGSKIPCRIYGAFVYADLVGATFPGFYQEHPLGFDLDEYGFNEVTGHGTLTDGCIAIGDPSHPGHDILDNPLQHLPKTAQNNLKVTGFTGAWDGVAYGLTDLICTSTYDYEFINLKRDNIAGYQPLVACVDAGDLEVRLNVGTGKIEILKSRSASLGTFVYTIAANISYESVRVTGNESGCSLYINGTLEESLSFSTTFNLASVVTLFGYSGNCFYGSCHKVIRRNTSDTIVNHWLIESRKDSEQPTIYDRVGGNHATLTDATLGGGGFWTGEKEGSELLEHGFSEGGYGAGDNLASDDGIFPDSDLSDWWVGNNITANIVDSEVECSFNGPLNYSHHNWFSSLVMGAGAVVGEHYELSFDATHISGTGKLQYGCLYAIDGTIDPADNGGVKKSYGPFTVEGSGASIINIGHITFGSVSPSVWRLDNIKVRKVPTGLIPASTTNPGVSVLGQPLTNKPGQIENAPVILEAIQSPEWVKADETPGFFFEVNGNVKQIDSGSIPSNTNDQYFWSTIKGIFAGYLSPRTIETTTKILKYLKLI